MTAMGTVARAASVPAGTVLTTRASLIFNANGDNDTVSSAPVSVTVDKASMATISLSESSVVTGGPHGVSCSITNAGNYAGDFRVTVTHSDNTDAYFALDANGDGVWQRSESTPVTLLRGLEAGKAASGFLVVRPRPGAPTGAKGTAMIFVTPQDNPNAEKSAWVSVTLGDTAVRPVFTFDAGDALNASPTVRDGLALAGSDAGVVYAVKARGADAGTLAWRYPAKGGVGAPVRGRVAMDETGYYFTANNGWAYHLDKSGREVWKTGVVPSEVDMEAMPLVDDSTVTLACGDGRVRRLDKFTGRLLSESQELGGGSLTTPSAPRPGELWLGAADGSLYTVNDVQGYTVLSAYTVSDKAVLATPYVDVASGLVLSVTPEGNVFAMRIRSNHMAWGPVALGVPVNGAPWVDSRAGVAFLAATDGRLFALFVKDGKPVPGYPVQVAQGGGFQNTPVVVPTPAGSTVAFLASDDGKVYGVDTSFPTRPAVFDTGDPDARFLGSPAVSGIRADDVLVATASNGTLYGFLAGDLMP